MRARQWRRGLLAFLFLLVAFWFLSLIIGLVGKVHIVLDEVQNVQRKYEELEKRRIVLEANLAALETSLGKDAAIRTTFGVARPGEEVIVVVPPAPVVQTESLTLWEKILEWFSAKSPYGI